MYIYVFYILPLPQTSPWFIAYVENIDDET